jgi:DNA repair protein RecO (recombination protein O)
MRDRKTYTAEALCLRAIDYGEADKILHLYTAEHGKITAFAKGAKRANSKLGAACERLNLFQAQLAHGRSMETLCQVDSKQLFWGLREDVLKLGYGLLFADLVYSTEAANADSAEIFELLRNSLERLSHCQNSETLTHGIRFQLEWLDIAGFHPILDQCILSGEFLQEDAVYYCFSSSMGGLANLQTRNQWRALHPSQDKGVEWVNVSAKTIELLKNPFNEAWSDAQCIKAQKFLQYYLLKVLEKKIPAYDFLFQLIELEPAAG